MDQPTTSPDSSTVASSLKELNKMYDGERVGLPLSDYMAESLNVMGKHHMERAPLESLLGQQIRPSNIDLQLKQVNEEIYTRQGGLMSSARGKDGALRKINNIIQKSMFPQMRVANKLYLADITEAAAPSMKGGV